MLMCVRCWTGPNTKHNPQDWKVPHSIMMRHNIHPFIVLLIPYQCSSCIHPSVHPSAELFQQLSIICSPSLQFFYICWEFLLDNSNMFSGVAENLSSGTLFLPCGSSVHPEPAAATGVRLRSSWSSAGTLITEPTAWEPNLSPVPLRVSECVCACVCVYVCEYVMRGCSQRNDWRRWSHADQVSSPELDTVSSSSSSQTAKLEGLEGQSHNTTITTTQQQQCVELLSSLLARKRNEIKIN